MLLYKRIISNIVELLQHYITTNEVHSNIYLDDDYLCIPTDRFKNKKRIIFAACINVKYLSKNIGIFLNISLQGKEVYSEEVSGMLLMTIL